MSEPTTLARVVVGSQLHGLALPDSDTDVRRVWASTLAEILAPWPLEPPAMDAEEDGWELRHFVGLIVKGNPTVLEVLASDLTLGPVDPRWPELQRLSTRMLDPDTAYRAHVGYILSQRKLIVDAERRGDHRRATKAAAAALRIADQGAEFLQTGILNPRVTRYRDLIMAIRSEGLAGERESAWRRELDLAVARLDAAAAAPHPALVLDREVVMRFLGSAHR